MKSREAYPPARLEDVRTYSALERPTKVDRQMFIAPTRSNPSLLEFLDSLPQLLKADELRNVVDAIVHAQQPVRI